MILGSKEDEEKMEYESTIGKELDKKMWERLEETERVSAEKMQRSKGWPEHPPIVKSTEEILKAHMKKFREHWDGWSGILIEKSMKIFETQEDINEMVDLCHFIAQEHWRHSAKHLIEFLQKGGTNDK